VERLVEALRAASSVFVLTGSGISAESGLPTFRGAGGLWRTHRVEELASAEGFARDPELVWTWYNERKAAHQNAAPNAGHVALARLERKLPDFTLATQNVDSLHFRAGSQRVVELHGNLREARCTRCDARHALEAEGLPLDRLRHSCGGMMRPNIVWFGEPLPPASVAASPGCGFARRRHPRRRDQRRGLPRRRPCNQLQRACVRCRDQSGRDRDQRRRRLRFA
jgi:NAD-dependent deacetylase